MDISKSTHTALPSTVSTLGENKYLTKAYSNYLASFFEQKLENTLSKIKLSLLADPDLGSAYPEVFNSLTLSRIFLEVAELNEAQKFLSEARVLIRQTGSSQLAFNLSMLQSELFFTLGKNVGGLDELSKVMRTGRKNQYFGASWLHPNMMSELCLKALQNNIEIDYVQQLIKKQHLIPGKSAFDLKSWPWKVRVYTFGRFSVLINDKPMNLHSKGKNKPIELLKVLIALGGRNIAEPQISEILWSDVDGDQAHSSFTTTLSRLRKVLGKKT
ncbi:MAG: hypothetical protein KAI17_11610, partial [Thiotrichaceae bacterium]|nr:hypothetical protein [Thiotrichaceae bacterium]